MNRWVIHDSQTTVLEGFNPSLLPKEASQFLTAYIQKNEQGKDRVVLEAGPYVGALPLLDGSTLYIAPRVGYASLSRMVSITERLDDAVHKEFSEFIELSYEDAEFENKWINLLTRSFIEQLRLIEKSSLRSERVWQAGQSSVVRGRVDLVRTALNLLQDKENPVITHDKIKTYNSIENRFLGAAAQTILNLNLVNGEEKKILLRWSKFLGRNPLTVKELDSISRNLAGNYYAGSRSYYIQALVMARLLLLQGSVSFEGLEKIRTEALLTNVYSLYENYLRILLRRHLTEKGFLVEKLESGTPTLFLDGTAELKPDILVSKANRVRLLLDAKYKLGEVISSGDYYQVNAYMDVFTVERGVIVRPSMRNDGNTMLSRKLYNGKSVYEINLDIRNWSEAEKFFVNEVEKLLIS